jgi:maltose alpha-D-glucosyltransferase/alpha-amylase
MGTPELDIEGDADPEWLSAEQSNSSVVLGERAVLKLLRKIQPGIHPDAEMVRYLTASGFANTPPILGEVRLDQDGETSLLMLVQRFVYNQGDGWNWTLGILERLASDDETSFSNYENFARNFGRRLAEMHAILAGPSADPAFAPEPLTRTDVERLSSRILRQFNQALDLMNALTTDHEGTRVAASVLLEHRQLLTERIRTVAREAEGSIRTRIHGDLHLGQILVTGSDLMIIDFEGEPAKPLADRRDKDIAWRDVAGVLRSFDYAAAVGQQNLPASSEGDQYRARERYTAFRDSAVRAFLSGYTGSEEAGVEPLLDLFVLEKAAYEIAYEAANRPDWIRVPVAGLARAAERLLGGNAT